MITLFLEKEKCIKFANKNNIPVKEKRITRDEIYIADEAFFTGTAAEVTPIRELDGRIIGSGKRGSLTEKLQKQYFDCVSGKVEEYKNWLNYISSQNLETLFLH